MDVPQRRGKRMRVGCRVLYDSLGARPVEDKSVERARVVRVRQVHLAAVTKNPGEGVIGPPEPARQQ